MNRGGTNDVDLLVYTHLRWEAIKEIWFNEFRDLQPVLFVKKNIISLDTIKGDWDLVPSAPFNKIYRIQ